MKQSGETLSMLWRKTGPKRKRIPFTEFVENYNKEKKGEKFNNLIATDGNLVKADLYDNGGEFADQIAVSQVKDTFYTMQSVSDAENPIKTISITERDTTASTDQPAASVATGPETSTALLFAFGVMVGVAAVLIIKKKS